MSESPIQEVTLLLDNAQMELYGQFHALSIIHGFDHTVVLTDLIKGFVDSYAETRTFISAHHLPALCEKTFNGVFPRANLYHWRKNELIEGVDYWQVRRSGVSEVVYNWDTLSVFLEKKLKLAKQVVKKRKKVLTEKEEVQRRKKAEKQRKRKTKTRFFAGVLGKPKPQRLPKE